MLAALASLHHLHLTAAGLDVVQAEIATARAAAGARAGAVISQQSTPSAEELLEHVLHRSLQGVGASVLPRPQETAVEQRLHSSAWLQLESVRNLTAPLAQQQEQGHGQQLAEQEQSGSRAPSRAPRLLQLELSDGVSTIPAIEWAPLSSLDVSSLQPGRKLLVRAGTPICHGVMLLSHDRLGLPPRGGVERMNLALAAQRTADANRKERADGEPQGAHNQLTAPAFRPFAQREQAQREADWERQAAESRMREQQRKEAALMPLHPPPQIEEAAGRMHATAVHVATTARAAASATSSRPTSAASHPVPSPAAPAVAATTTSKAARAHTQIELENEYKRELESKAKAAAVAASSSVLPITRPHSGAATGAVAANLSSFRTLLQTSIGSAHAFSAVVADLQLYPPPAGQSAFVLQFTLQDSFSLRAVATASTRVFERFFWPQNEFASMMATPVGQTRVQKRLAECRTRLCLPRHYWDVELEVRAGILAGAARSFVLTAIGEWVRGSINKQAGSGAAAKPQPAPALH